MKLPATIVVEDLSLRKKARSAKGTKEEPGVNVAAKSGLHRAMHDTGMGMLNQLHTYGAEQSGGRLIEVDARNTSQDCRDRRSRPFLCRIDFGAHGVGF